MNSRDKVLIANRGEIACRIIGSCRRLGLKTVAVFSEADRGALHVELADEAIEIGPAPARDSYLKSDAILEAARRSGAGVIHPGYGFLAENSGFARLVLEAGMVWVGPAPSSIDDMGDKERARSIAETAGVRVLPGSVRFKGGETDGLRAAAEQVGFPLLVKAAAGGGGIGMRRVDEPHQLEAVVESTQSMADKAFGDSSVYLERYVGSSRHIEVQVFGFGDGSGVHLFDRDCSVQRRFQKIIEEAPAPDLPQVVREELQRAALALVRHQRYSGAGTVEFIYDNERSQAYFLEMNTRIQVEHPATEMITGVDLVSWQIQHALGQLDRIDQDKIVCLGHAVECRLYAERPEKNFLPAPGLLSKVDWPEQNSTLRVDTGVRAGDRVTAFYDPLVAKLIAHGISRDDARERLARALGALQVEGLDTNVHFLRRVLTDPEFREGGVTTGFVADFLDRKRALDIEASVS